MPDLDLLRSACAPFGLDPDRARFVGRSQNTVYEFTEPPSILRVTQGRGTTLAQVQAELAWVDHLANRGLPVCRPRALRPIVPDGVAAHFDRAPGRKITDADVNAEMYRRIGHLLGQLHVASFDNAPFELHSRRPWYQSRLVVDDVARFTPPTADRFRLAVSQLIAILRRQTDHRLGPIHADVGFSNLFIDGDRLWLFDFDNCELGTPEQDLATVLYDNIICRQLNRVPQHDLSTAVRTDWSAVIDGYRAVRPTADLDADVIRQFVLLREAVIYTHYCRTLDPAKITDAWRAGMDEMRENVERGMTAIDGAPLRTT